MPDEATHALMVALYGRLFAGVGLAEALRAAKRELRQREPSVAAWGAFLAFGDPSPLPATVHQ